MTNLDYMKLPQNNNPPKLRNLKNQVQLGGMMENCNPDMGCVCRSTTSGRQKGRKRKEKLGLSGTFRDQMLVSWYVDATVAAGSPQTEVSKSILHSVILDVPTRAVEEAIFSTWEVGGFIGLKQLLCFKFLANLYRYIFPLSTCGGRQVTGSSLPLTSFIPTAWR